jgi:hypothetical protein
MAFKMKGAPMHDLSSKHGTNANYKKSGAPGLLGKILDPLGLKKKLFGGKGGNCPPAAGGDPAAAPAARPAEPGAVAPAAPAAAAPAAAAPEEAVPTQMKEDLLTDPKSKKKKERELKDQKIKRMDYIPKPPKGDKATTRKEWMRTEKGQARTSKFDQGKGGAPMKDSPAKGILGDKWRDAKSSVKRAGRKAIAAGAGAKAWAKEAFGDKEHHMGDGHGLKNPNWEASKAYNKKRDKQLGKEGMDYTNQNKKSTSPPTTAKGKADLLKTMRRRQELEKWKKNKNKK